MGRGRQSLETLGSLKSWVCRQLGCGQKGREGLREEGEPSGCWGRGRRPGAGRAGSGLDWRRLALMEVLEQRGQGWGRKNQPKLLPCSLSFTFAEATLR